MLWHASAYIVMRIRAHLSNHIADGPAQSFMLLVQDMKHSVCDKEAHDWQWHGAYDINANCKSCWRCSKPFQSTNTCIHAFRLAAIWLM